MTPKQKRLVELREQRSRVTQRLAELSMESSLTVETRAEFDELEGSVPDLERMLRGAEQAVREEEEAQRTEQRQESPDAETRERVALRSRASLGRYLLARMEGRLLDGAEHELSAATSTRAGSIPFDMWERPAPQTERRVVTGTPATTGVNLDVIRPAIFSKSVCPRLSIAMPKVNSGTYASATIGGSLTAAALAKGTDAAATSATFSVSTSAPKRISARLEIALEDLAAVGQDNWESALRENLSLVLMSELDNQCLNGDGQGVNLSGFFHQLMDPAAPGATVASFDDFVAAFAGGIDGLWALKMSEIMCVVGATTYALSAQTFRDAAGQDLGDMAFSDYAMKMYGGNSWWTNSRMPAAANNIQEAILHRGGMSEFMNADGGIRLATLPTWAEVGITDIYSGSASGTTSFTLHVIVGDLVLQQPNAYRQISFRTAV